MGSNVTTLCQNIGTTHNNIFLVPTYIGKCTNKNPTYLSTYVPQIIILRGNV